MVSCQFFEVKSFEIYGAANIYRNYLVTILSRMFLKQKTWALLLVMILIGVIMLAQSAVRSMEPSLVLGDWQMSPLSPFDVVDFYIEFGFSRGVAW
jgi:hypothetical protein